MVGTESLKNILFSLDCKGSNKLQINKIHKVTMAFSTVKLIPRENYTLLILVPIKITKGYH